MLLYCCRWSCFPRLSMTFTVPRPSTVPLPSTVWRLLVPIASSGSSQLHGVQRGLLRPSIHLGGQLILHQSPETVLLCSPHGSRGCDEGLCRPQFPHRGDNHSGGTWYYGCEISLVRCKVLWCERCIDVFTSTLVFMISVYILRNGGGSCSHVTGVEPPPVGSGYPAFQLVTPTTMSPNCNYHHKLGVQTGTTWYSGFQWHTLPCRAHPIQWVLVGAQFHGRMM